jgi:hypothetical protein
MGNASFVTQATRRKEGTHRNGSQGKASRKRVDRELNVLGLAGGFCPPYTKTSGYRRTRLLVLQLPSRPALKKKDFRSESYVIALGSAQKILTYFLIAKREVRRALIDAVRANRNRGVSISGTCSDKANCCQRR